MAWHPLTNLKSAAPIGKRIDVLRRGVGFVVGLIDTDGRREVVA